MAKATKYRASRHADTREYVVRDIRTGRILVSIGDPASGDYPPARRAKDVARGIAKYLNASVK